MTPDDPAPGPRNAITDVAGIAVGNAEDHALSTGTTVVVADAPAVAAVDVRGGGPGTRETDALRAGSSVETVDAVVLSGGSAFGLDAAGGAMDWLRAQGRGYGVGAARVPIVPAAILFDLLTPGVSDWERPPWWALGRAAAAAAGPAFALGNAGAGLGATAGPLKGGLGTASWRTAEWTVGAVAAVNAWGSAVMPGSRTFWAWDLERGGELGGQVPPERAPAPETLPEPAPRRSTTIAVVATDARLTRPGAQRVAVMAQTGLARAIRPAHAPLDGDAVFVLSTGERALEEGPGPLARLGAAAADTLARAIMRGVYEAAPLGPIPAYRSAPA